MRIVRVIKASLSLPSSWTRRKHPRAASPNPIKHQKNTRVTTATIAKTREFNDIARHCCCTREELSPVPAVSKSALLLALAIGIF
jgi:hypothetical protein